MTLVSVYQGTQGISVTLIANYLNNCLKKGHSTVPTPVQFEFCDVSISEECIEIQPQIFDEEKPCSAENVIYLGDMSSVLESYFRNFFQINLHGTFEDLIKFNAQTVKEVIGGDPDYIAWCLRKGIIDLGYDTKNELERLQIYKLVGVKIKSSSLNKYSFEPVYQTEFYKFKAGLPLEQDGRP